MKDNYNHHPTQSDECLIRDIYFVDHLAYLYVFLFSINFWFRSALATMQIANIVLLIFLFNKF